MSAKNQWESDVLQNLHDVNDLSRKHIEQARYWQRMESTCLLDGYTEGHLALIVNLDITREVECMQVGIHGHSVPKVFLPLVLYHDCPNSRVRLHFERQQMFVGVIKIVKNVEQSRVIRSLVGLYFGAHPMNKFWTDSAVGGMFFSVVQSRFDSVPFFVNREFQMASVNSGNPRSNETGPRNIERGTQIVDDISDNERQPSQSLREVWNLAYKMLNSCVIGLSCRNLTFFERDDGILHVNDVLIGPFNFQERIADNCTHNMR
jgi:hypothetical protein